jgi:hypothetical protein
MHVYSAHQILKDAGIPARSARAGAWFDLVRTAPPAVLAVALGVTANTAMRYATLAGTDYASYPHERASR